MNATDKQIKNKIDDFKSNEAKLDPFALKSFSNSKIARKVTTTPILPSFESNKEVNSIKDSFLILSRI